MLKCIYKQKINNKGSGEMNSFETEYSNLQVEEEEANTNKLALDTANLVDYVKNEMGVDLLEDKEVTYVKRYVDENLIDIVFTWKNSMYMATYLQGLKEFYVSNLIL